MKLILMFFFSFPKGDKLIRATELAKLLTLEKSVKGALTLVTRLKLPMLQEKFSSILEVKAAHINFKLTETIFFSKLDSCACLEHLIKFD